MWQAYLIDPNHPEVCEFVRQLEPSIKNDLEQASSLVLKEQYEQALVFLKKGLDKHKNDHELNLLKAYILRKQKKFSDTIYILERMEEYLSKLHPAALPASEVVNRKKKISDNFALLYNDMAAYLFDQKDYKDASLLFMQAKKFKIDDPGILCNIGDCALVGVSNPEEARRTRTGQRMVRQGQQDCGRSEDTRH